MMFGLSFAGLWEAATGAGLTHPFWIFEWEELNHEQVPITCAVLFFASVLCSASGIGGGGIYVAVLMVIGGLTTHNAVPLSKAVVFFGAVSSTVLNLRRQLMGGEEDGKAKACINFEVCRLVVPMALAGTFLGVMLNFQIPEKVIIIALTSILCLMTVLVIRTAWTQHCEEAVASAGEGPGRRGLADTHDEVEVEAFESQPLVHRRKSPSAGNGFSYASTPDLPSGERHLMSAAPVVDKSTKVNDSRGEAVTKVEVGCAVCLILLVIVGGVLRFHVNACSKEKEGIGSQGSCAHPVVRAFFGKRFEQMMDSRALATVLAIATTSLPMWTCIGISAYYGYHAHRRGWSAPTIFTYQLGSLATGVLAGLVGIGGGLIFSPLFLLMGLEPHIAVATSSTCVLFTSSSTTIQYFFTDRIVLSLALLYGVVTFVASMVGTTLIHVMQDRFSAKRSYITWVVAVGIAISAGLSLTKFFASPKQIETMSLMNTYH